MYIDANRNELDIDPELVEGDWPVPLEPAVSKRGLGLLKSKSRYGEPVQEKKLTYEEVEYRLETYHRPYHRELRALIERHRAAYGFVYHISCHCMSAVGAPTHPDAGKPRADFCLGNLNGKTASDEFIEFVADEIRNLGRSCTINDPYSGGEINARYGDPAAGVQSIMVEINKKLFMDINTFQRTAGFDRVKADVSTALAAITRRARDEQARRTR